MVDPEPITLEEIERDGVRRVYKVRISADRVANLTAARVKEIGHTVRLPGFRPGKIPDAVLYARYGSKARAEVIRRLGAEAADRVLARSELAASTEILAGGDSGDVEFRLEVTHLPDLPPLRFDELKLERLSASEAELSLLGLSIATAQELFDNRLRQQVLDSLDAMYRFPIAQALVAREYAVIRQAAEAALAAGSTGPAELAAMSDELLQIAERRVRLGAVVTEMARRYEIHVTEDEIRREHRHAEQPGQTRDRLRENRLIELILSKAPPAARDATPDELRGLAEATD
jgi:FKBP-type peptidyl-prolyl cis-trans isomerase (trigger factor)